MALRASFPYKCSYNYYEQLLHNMEEKFSPLNTVK